MFYGSDQAQIPRQDPKQQDQHDFHLQLRPGKSNPLKLLAR